MGLFGRCQSQLVDVSTTTFDVADAVGFFTVGSVKSARPMEKQAAPTPSARTAASGTNSGGTNIAISLVLLITTSHPTLSLFIIIVLCSARIVRASQE